MHRRERLRHATTAALGGAVLLLCLSTPGVFAQSPEQGEQSPTPSTPEARRGPDDDRQLIRALNLTPQQRSGIARIRRETEGQNRVIGQRIRRARRALEEAVYSPTIDERAVDELSQEVAAGETERVRLRAQTELRIRRLLTPAQLDVFRELRRRAAQRGRENRLPGDPALGGGRAPGPFNAAGRRQQQPGEMAPAKGVDDSVPVPNLTPRKRRRAERTRRLPLRRSLP